MITTDVDPFKIATLGITGSPITIATSGYIILIEEDIIEPPVLKRRGGGGIADPYYNLPREKQPKRKKRITAVVTIDGVEYRESIEVEDLTISAKDIKVEVTEGIKPTINLTVIRG